MEDIGKKIKHYRLKLGLKQSELAYGIISSSYLSKIENGRVNASPETIGFLCNKLGINPYSAEFESDIEICKKWFKYLLTGDKRRAFELYGEITKEIGFIKSDSLISLIEIHKLRYYILSEDEYKSTTQMRVLERKAKKFDMVEEYYWHKFSGDYYYSILSFDEAYKKYMLAEESLSRDLFFKEEEESNLYYQIGLTASKKNQSHLALVYTSKALTYYQNTYNLLRCAQCHILLGISYRRVNDIEKAKKNYEIAKQIGESLPNATILSTSLQNFGALYSSLNDSKRAIEYFKLSYESRLNSNTLQLLIPISSLMKENYKSKDFSNAIYWLQKGIKLTDSLNTEVTIFVLEFKVYEHLLLYDEGSPLLEKIILTEVLPFLEKKKLEYQKHIYLKILADYYYRKRKYKSAADYLFKANQTLNNIYND